MVELFVVLDCVCPAVLGKGNWVDLFLCYNVPPQIGLLGAKCCKISCRGRRLSFLLGKSRTLQSSCSAASVKYVAGCWNSSSLRSKDHCANMCRWSSWVYSKLANWCRLVGRCQSRRRLLFRPVKWAQSGHLLPLLWSDSPLRWNDHIKRDGPDCIKSAALLADVSLWSFLWLSGHRYFDRTTGRTVSIDSSRFSGCANEF